MLLIDCRRFGTLFSAIKHGAIGENKEIPSLAFYEDAFVVWHKSAMQ